MSENVKTLENSRKTRKTWKTRTMMQNGTLSEKPKNPGSEREAEILLMRKITASLTIFTSCSSIKIKTKGELISKVTPATLFKIESPLVIHLKYLKRKISK